jgi:hypothetical protein
MDCSAEERLDYWIIGLSVVWFARKVADVQDGAVRQLCFT